MKLYIWGGGVTVVIIVGVAEAMPDPWSEAIDFVHPACLSLVALGPSFVLKKQVGVSALSFCRGRVQKGRRKFSAQLSNREHGIPSGPAAGLDESSLIESIMIDSVRNNSSS